MKKILIYTCVAAGMLLLFERCARIPGSIAGGAKDEIAPTMLMSIPPNYATGITPKRVEITFDEFLQLKDANNQFFSSPPMKKKPEILLYGNRVRVNLKEPLLQNVTYSFDFGQSISDLNEGNVATGFLYVFSTGNYIDTLSFTGRVLNAFDMKAQGKDEKTATWVLLYNDLSDSAVYQQTPTYVARADQLGFFTFSHIRPDTFRILALRDMNANLLFDMPTEQIAFADTLIVTDGRYWHNPEMPPMTSRNTADSIKEKNPELLRKDIMLYQFLEKPTRQYRVAYERKEQNMLRLIYSLPVDSIEIDVMEYEPAGKWYELETSANRDTLDYWLTDTALVNRKIVQLHLYSPRTDSLNRLVYTDDTLKLTFEAPKQPASTSRTRRERREDAEKPKPRTAVETMLITTNVKNNGTLDLTDRIRLVASQPIDSINPEKISLMEQVDTLKKAVAFAMVRDSVNARRASIDWTLKEDTKYFLTIDSMSFTSIYGVFNDSTGISFSTQKRDHYGEMEITFDSIPCPVVVQVIKGENEDLVKQVTLAQGKVATVDYLNPGKYGIKLIYDLNGNGKWDTGSYRKKLQPEKVAYFSEPEVEIHSNVKTELQWALSKKEEQVEEEADTAEEVEEES